MQSFTGISRNTQSKLYMLYRLSVSGISKIMHCGCSITCPFRPETQCYINVHHNTGIECILSYLTESFEFSKYHSDSECQYRKDKGNWYQSELHFLQSFLCKKKKVSGYNYDEVSCQNFKKCIFYQHCNNKTRAIVDTQSGQSSGPQWSGQCRMNPGAKTAAANHQFWNCGVFGQHQLWRCLGYALT